MTKVQMKENISKLNRQITKEHSEDNTLSQLQELCENYGDGHKWCSWTECLKQILRNSADKQVVDKAIDLYSQHCIIQANYDMLTDVYLLTNNFT